MPPTRGAMTLMLSARCWGGAAHPGYRSRAARVVCPLGRASLQLCSHTNGLLGGPGSTGRTSDIHFWPDAIRG